MFSYVMILETKGNLLYHKPISQNRIGHFIHVKLFPVFSSNSRLAEVKIKFFASFNSFKMYFCHGSEVSKRE